MNAPVAPTSMPIQRYCDFFTVPGTMTHPDGEFVRYADHRAALKAAKTEAVKMGLEAAVKACEVQIMRVPGNHITVYNGAALDCADAIRTIDHEEVLKGAA